MRNSFSKNPLERAIHQKSIQSGEHGDARERLLFESRKRGRIATITSSFSDQIESDGQFDEAEGDALYWKLKYQKLEQECSKNTSTIAVLKHNLSDSSERCAKLEECINLMDQKTIELQIQLDQENKKNSNRQPSIDKNAADKSKKTIELFEFLTSMKVEMPSLDQNEFVCTLKNKLLKKATKFILKKGVTEDDDVEFIPLANSDMLPADFRAHIAFEPNMAPVLMGDILQNLYEDPDEIETPQE